MVFLLRFVIYMLGVIVAVTLGAALFLYSMTRQEVLIAQQMVEDASRLQIEKCSLSDALAFAHKYNGEAAGTSHDKPCLESDCLITVAPDTNDFWERHPKLRYVADRISRRGWRFSVWMWVRDGKLTAIQQSFGYSTPHIRPFVITTLSPPSRGLCRNPFYRLHHTFAAYPGPKHFNVWVNSAATQEREMLRLNLDCVLRISGCKSVADMAPAAWRKYQADQPLIDADESNGPNELAADSECR